MHGDRASHTDADAPWHAVFEANIQNVEFRAEHRAKHQRAGSRSTGKYMPVACTAPWERLQHNDQTRLLSVPKSRYVQDVTG